MEGNEQDTPWMLITRLGDEEAQAALREGATNVFQLGDSREVARVVGYSTGKNPDLTAEKVREAKIEEVYTDPDVVTAFIAAMQEKQERKSA